MNTKNQKINHYSCGVICFHDDNVLVILQHNGHWSFPKGTQEEGESDLETALRELHEEAGIEEVEIDKVFCHKEKYFTDFPDGRKLKQVTYFIGNVLSPEVTVDQNEVVDSKWLVPKEALEQLTYDSTKDTLLVVLKHKNLL